MKPLLLLDFDSTLFKTMDFWQDFSVVFGKLSGISPKTFQGHYFDYTVGDGLVRTIDYAAMLADAQLTNEQVTEAVKSELANKSYLYEDAQRLLRILPKITSHYDVAMLTFGQEAFQLLKIGQEPSLGMLQTYITLDLKSHYIANHFADRPSGFLVDDKPGQGLPAGWTEIHIDRYAKTYESPQHTENAVFRITSLDDVIDCIDLQ